MLPNVPYTMITKNGLSLVAERKFLQPWKSAFGWKKSNLTVGKPRPALSKGECRNFKLLCTAQIKKCTWHIHILNRLDVVAIWNQAGDQLQVVWKRTCSQGCYCFPRLVFLINHPFWATPIFGNTHMTSTSAGWTGLEQKPKTWTNSTRSNGSCNAAAWLKMDKEPGYFQPHTVV